MRFGIRNVNEPQPDNRLTRRSPRAAARECSEFDVTRPPPSYLCRYICSRLLFLIDIAQILTELTALSIHDRLRVVESLWNSIPAASPVEISPEQRRITAHGRSPEQLLTWDEVLDRLRDSR